MGSRLECALCGGAYDVQGPSDDGSRTRVRCADCGHTEEVEVARLQPASPGKWTVIDPSGEVRSFATVEELIAYQASLAKAEPAPTAPESAPEPAVEAAAPDPAVAPPFVAQATSSAAAILDDMPSQPLSVVPSRLEIVQTESETDLSKHDPDDDAPPVSSKDIDASAVDSVPPDSGIGTKEEEQPLSMRDLQVVPVPKLPASASIPPKPAVQASIPPPLPERAKSLRPAPKPSKAPEKPPEKAEPITVKSATHVEAARRDEPAKEEPKKATTKKEREPRKPKKPEEMKHEDLMKPSIAPAAPAEPAPDAKNGWVTPVLAVAAIIVAVWFVTKGGNNATTDATPPKASTTSTATAPSAAPSESAAAVTPSATPSASHSAEPAGSARASTSALPIDKSAASKLHPKPGDSSSPATPASASETEPAAAKEPTTVPELLDHAAKARRAGDPARARELYDRVLASSPGNVEALYGLGNVARAEGNLAGAKAAFQKAVAANGSFLPALLGLADAEWDSGDKASAKAHYAQLYKSSPASAPPRAKERAEISE